MTQRYFFDLVGAAIHYDYHGRDFSCPQAACDFAELTAFDLALYPEDQWCGWTIKVKAASGEQIFSVNVPESSRICGIPIATRSPAGAVEQHVT